MSELRYDEEATKKLPDPSNDSCKYGLLQNWLAIVEARPCLVHTGDPVLRSRSDGRICPQVGHHCIDIKSTTQPVCPV